MAAKRLMTMAMIIENVASAVKCALWRVNGRRLMGRILPGSSCDCKSNRGSAGVKHNLFDPLLMLPEKSWKYDVSSSALLWSDLWRLAYRWLLLLDSPLAAVSVAVSLASTVGSAVGSTVGSVGDVSVVETDEVTVAVASIALVPVGTSVSPTAGAVASGAAPSAGVAACTMKSLRRSLMICRL